MTMTTRERPLSAAGDAYLAAVGVALGGVPDTDRQELLDDLAEHLAELADASDAELVDRLGPPAQYAAELLASAGIEPAARKGWSRSRLAARVRAETARFDTPIVHKLHKFALELRPGWWVARGWLVVAAIAAQDGLQEALWLPNVTHNDIQNLVLLGGAIALSVWAGRGPKWAAWIATALGILALFSVATADRSSFYAGNDQAYYPEPGMLTAADGSVITNLFPYDSAGKPIRAFLFDQNGIPLNVGNGEMLQGIGVPFISGLFPQPTVVWNNAGSARAVQPEPPRVAVPRLPQPTDTKKPTKASTTTTIPKPKPTTATSPITSATG